MDEKLVALMEKYEALNRQKMALSERETQMQDMAVSIDDIEDLVKEVSALQKQEADQLLVEQGVALKRKRSLWDERKEAKNLLTRGGHFGYEEHMTREEH
ncbi:hypothetical protein Tco_0296820 [Tanacetum coccineum]